MGRANDAARRHRRKSRNGVKLTERLWRRDEMRWAMAPADVKHGDEWEWAQQKLRAVNTAQGMRYEERK